jgi:hypothetical protein
MNTRTSSIFAFSATAAAAVLGTFVMAGSAHAEGPQGEASPVQTTPRVSRPRAEVQAEVMAHRAQLTSSASEWTMQQGPAREPSGYTRAQAQADFIAHREEVQAMTSEHGGGNGFGRTGVHIPGPVYAGNASRQ